MRLTSKKYWLLTMRLDDSPYQGGPDRLDRLNVAKAAVNVIKQIEGPTSSVACSLVGSWGSGKSQTANFIVDGMIRDNPEPKEKRLSPMVSFTLTLFYPRPPLDRHLIKFCIFQELNFNHSKYPILLITMFGMYLQIFSECNSMMITSPSRMVLCLRLHYYSDRDISMMITFPSQLV